MTTDLALLALKAWIELRTTAAYPVLSGIPILLRDTLEEQPGDDDEEDADDFNATFIVLTESGEPEEHPVLRGVLTMPLECKLVTVAAEDLGSTDAQHRALNAALYHILADKDGIAFCNNYPSFRCWDIRGTAPSTDTAEGQRVTTFAMSMVGAAVG